MARVYVSKRKNKEDNKELGMWSDNIKAQAAMMYVETGSLPTIVKALGVPIGTLNTWLRNKWWDELTQAIQKEQDTRINGEVTTLIDKALKAVSDRIENGDYQYNPTTGDLMRIPVKAQVLGRLQSDLMKQRKEFVERPTVKETDDKHQLESKLLQLADTFTSFVKKKDATKERLVNEFEVLIDGTIIDGNGDVVESSSIKNDPFNFGKEPTIAIHDQRTP